MKLREDGTRCLDHIFDTTYSIRFPVASDGYISLPLTSDLIASFPPQAAEKPWSTVGVSTNIISASMSALLDGFEYALVEFGPSCSIERAPVSLLEN